MSIEAENTEIDTTIKDLLQLILIELKIMNTYNVLGHDKVIKEEDVNED